jgi:hypothetical protein
MEGRSHLEGEYEEEVATVSGWSAGSGTQKSYSTESEALSALTHISNIVRAAAEGCPELLTNGNDDAINGLLGARQQLIGWLQTQTRAENSSHAQNTDSLSSTPRMAPDRDWSASTTEDYRDNASPWANGTGLDSGRLDSFSDSSEESNSHQLRSTLPFSFNTSASVPYSPQNSRLTQLLDSYGSFDNDSLMPVTKRPRLASSEDSVRSNADHEMAPSQVAAIPVESHNATHAQTGNEPTAQRLPGPAFSPRLPLSNARSSATGIPLLKLPPRPAPEQAPMSANASGPVPVESPYAVPHSHFAAPHRGYEYAGYAGTPQWVQQARNIPGLNLGPAFALNAHSPHISPYGNAGETSTSAYWQQQQQAQQQQQGNGAYMYPPSVTPLSRMQAPLPHLTPLFNASASPHHATQSPHPGPPPQTPYHPAYVAMRAQQSHNEAQYQQQQQQQQRQYQQQQQQRIHSGEPQQPNTQFSPYLPSSSPYSLPAAHFYGSVHAHQNHPMAQLQNQHQNQQRMGSGRQPAPMPPTSSFAHPNANANANANAISNANASEQYDPPLITKTVSKTGRPLPPVSMFKVKPSKSTPLPQIDPTAASASAMSSGQSKLPASLASMVAPGLMDSFDWRKPTPPGRKKAGANRVASSAPEGNAKLSDFTLLGVLGTGTFGKVHLCQHIPSKQYYCMKVLKKQTIFRFKQMDHIINEKQLLSQLRYQGIVQLYSTFTTQDSLMLLMEYVPGGELFYYIRKFGRLSEDVARFYAAELVLTILHLHERQIVYRDLKPENILLDSNGHLKLADFGFAKRVIDKTWTMCGTPDYLAPEIITGRGHDTAVDWWSLGVLIFEMLAGYPPFTDKDMGTLFRKIQEPERLFIPSEFSQESADLIRRLLVVDPSRRLGNIHLDISDIQSHPWFRSVHWEQAQQRLLPGPIVPILPNPADIALHDQQDPNSDPSAIPHPPLHIPEDVMRLFDRF